MELPLKDKNDNMMKPTTSKDTIVKLLKKKALVENSIKVNKNKKSYEQMIIEAISTLKERNGATIPGIKKYISSVFLIPVENSSRYILKYLKKGIEDGVFISERKFRYKLSRETLKKIQKKIEGQTKKNKIKTKKDKENIEPKEEGKKKIKAKNDKIKISKEKNSKNDKTKTEKLTTEKPKKHKIGKKGNDSNKENETEEPVGKKIKTNNKIVKLVEEINETNKINVKTITKLKSKAFKAPTPLIVAGNKLKKQARKSLIKLNMKKQKKILNGKSEDVQQDEN